jgi:hypothetical protein
MLAAENTVAELKLDISLAQVAHALLSQEV